MAMLLIGIVAGVLFWLLRRVIVILRFRRSADIPFLFLRTKGGAASGVSHLRRPISWWTLVVPTCIALIVLSFAGYLYWESISKLDLAPSRPNYALAVLYFLVMLAGMAAEYMFGLKSFKQFAVAEFVRPFWVSLIVFSVPWSLVDKNAMTFGSILACYQNGFFWKKVLERRRGK